MGDRILEPVKRRALQVRKHECHLVGVIQEVLAAEKDVHAVLEQECVKLAWVGTVKWVGFCGLTRDFDLEGAGGAGGTESMARWSVMARSVSIN